MALPSAFLTKEQIAHAKTLYPQFNTLWPALFDRGQLKPLVIGIHEIIVESGHFSEDDTAVMLRFWTSRKEYRAKLINGEHRYNLLGEPVDIIALKP